MDNEYQAHILIWVFLWLIANTILIYCTILIRTLGSDGSFWKLNQKVNQERVTELVKYLGSTVVKYLVRKGSFSLLTLESRSYLPLSRACWLLLSTTSHSWPITFSHMFKDANFHSDFTEQFPQLLPESTGSRKLENTRPTGRRQISSLPPGLQM